MSYDQGYGYQQPQGHRGPPPQQRSQPTSQRPPAQMQGSQNYAQPSAHSYDRDQYGRDQYYKGPPQDDRSQRRPADPYNYDQRDGARPDTRGRPPPPQQDQRRNDYGEGQWQDSRSRPPQQDWQQGPPTGNRRPQEGFGNGNRQPDERHYDTRYHDSRAQPPPSPHATTHQNRPYADGPSYGQPSGQGYGDSRSRQAPQQDYNQYGRNATQESRGRDQGYGGYDSRPDQGMRPPMDDQRRPSQTHSDHGGYQQPQAVYQQPQYANSTPGQALSIDHPPRDPSQSRGQRRPPPIDVSSNDHRAPSAHGGPRRPLIEPMSPATLPQDNAFPLFPTTKPKKQSVDEKQDTMNQAPVSQMDKLARDARDYAPLQSPTIRLEPPSPMRPTTAARSVPLNDYNAGNSTPFDHGDGPLPSPTGQTRFGGPAPMDNLARDRSRDPVVTDTGRHPQAGYRSASQEQSYTENSLPYRGRQDDQSNKQRFGGPASGPYDNGAGPLPGIQDSAARPPQHIQDQYSNHGQTTGAQAQGYDAGYNDRGRNGSASYEVSGAQSYVRPPPPPPPQEQYGGPASTGDRFGQQQTSMNSQVDETRRPSGQTRFGGPAPSDPRSYDDDDRRGPLPPPQGRFDDRPPQSPMRAGFGNDAQNMQDPQRPTQDNSYRSFSASRPEVDRGYGPGQPHDGPPRAGPAHRRGNSQSEQYANGYINDIGQMPRNDEPNRNARIEAEMPNFGNMDSSYGASRRDEYSLPPANPQGYDGAQSAPPPNMRSASGGQTYGSQYGPGQPDARGPNDQMYQNQNGAASAPNVRYGAGDPYGPGQAQGAYPPGQQRQPMNGPPGGPSRGPSGGPPGPPGQGYGPRPVPTRQGLPDAYGRSSLDGSRPPNAMNQPGRAPSAPPTQGNFGAPLSQQMSNRSNPDSLPNHPVPVRPGLMNNGTGSQPGGRPPGRTYPSGTGSTSSEPDSRRSSTNNPVTQQEINQLQSLVNAHPQDYATGLLLAKKLVEASTVLASENGRLDARQTANNRERYVLDAHRRVKKLVSAGYPDAMFYLADCYGQGLLGLKEDPKEAFTLYQAAAKAGHGQAAYRTAMCCELGPEEGGGTRKDPQKAVQWYKRAAQLADVTAMYKMGIINLNGLLAEQKNVLQAEIWLKRAAEKADKENPHALHQLGVLYEPENPDREVRQKIIPDVNYSRELFFKAANWGYMKSQFRLGQAYEYGTLGLPVDARNSIAWYSKAAAQGEHQAELALSGWYLTGAEGILPNSDQEAYLWARKAAMADPPLAKAMFAMGYYTETGIGCTANLDEAKKWYMRAASYKFPKAIDRLEELKRGGGKKGPPPAAAGVVRKEIKDRTR